MLTTCRWVLLTVAVILVLGVADVTSAVHSPLLQSLVMLPTKGPAQRGPAKSLVNIEDVIDSITVQYIDALVLRDLSAPDTFNCLSDELAVGEYASSSNNNLLYSMSIINVTEYNAQDEVDAFAQKQEVNVLQGIAPSSLTSIDGYLLVDPVCPFPRVHWANPNVVYFFPILEQELYVFAKYLSSGKSGSNSGNGAATLPSSIHAIINTETPASNEEVLTSLTRCMHNFSLDFQAVLTNTSVVDFLSPDSTNIVVGLRSNDISGLQSFLAANPMAVVVVLFDDLTIQYNVIGSTFANSDPTITSRILFTTNLPLWTHNYATYDVAMVVFFQNFGPQYHTPATLRAYFSMLLLDQLTSQARTTNSLRTNLYEGSQMGVDSTIMGDFTDICPFPTTKPLSCLVNFGAQNLYVWSYANVINTRSSALYGPITPPVSFFTQTEDLRELTAQSRFTIVGVMSGIIMGSFVLLLILATLCAGGYLDDVQAVLTVLHVTVDHTDSDNAASIFRVQEVLKCYSSVVDAIVEKHQAMQMDSSPNSFVLATRKPREGLALARDLIATVQQLHPQLPVGATVGLRIGIHTNICSCAQALDENDLDGLAIAAAPLTMLAQCVSELCSANEILLTGWTYAQLGENPLSRTCRLHSRNLLDGESVVIDVYRYSPHMSVAVERVLREDFSLMSLGSEMARQKKLSDVMPMDDPRMMESTLNRSDRLNTLGMNLLAGGDQSTDDMSSRLINYDI